MNAGITYEKREDNWAYKHDSSNENIIMVILFAFMTSNNNLLRRGSLSLSFYMQAQAQKNGALSSIFN